jgi:hypothetical protein
MGWWSQIIYLLCTSFLCWGFGLLLFLSLFVFLFNFLLFLSCMFDLFQFYWFFSFQDCLFSHCFLFFFFCLWVIMRKFELWPGCRSIRGFPPCYYVLDLPSRWRWRSPISVWTSIVPPPLFFWPLLNRSQLSLLRLPSCFLHGYSAPPQIYLALEVMRSKSKSYCKGCLSCFEEVLNEGIAV